MSPRFKVAVCLGIRPDVIRTSVLLKKMATHPNIDLRLIWTGQHYDHLLKDVFFEELGVPRPTVNLECGGGSHCSQHSRLIDGLGKYLEENRPDACLFLGDANAVIGCIAPLKMGIPVVHVEAGMRSYDWSMPEERNRVIIDRVSDVLYAYHEDHKIKLIREGICPTKIVVTGNTIVDVILENAQHIKPLQACSKYGVRFKDFALMTLHRDGNMNEGRIAAALRNVSRWACQHNYMTVLMPVMPRLKEIYGKYLSNYNCMKYIEPVGFFDFVSLESAAAIHFTDSGTNQETATIVNTPCVVMRPATERPETFDSGIVAMHDMDVYPAAEKVLGKYTKPGFSLGDGRASERILNDLVARLYRKFDRDTLPFVDQFKKQNHFGRNDGWHPDGIKLKYRSIMDGNL